MSDTICELLDLKTCKGDVGIEVEMEGLTPFPYDISKWWRAEADGSLRGHSVEYVMKRPAPINGVGPALELLKAEITAGGGSPIYSERAGVHVHLNVQKLTVKQVFATALTYYCMERSLVRFCGDNREGNHFCLRVQDAEYVLRLLENAITRDSLSYLDNEDIRYASLNFCSLFKYGSLEFRSLETQPDFAKIEDWAKIVVAIRDYAMKVDNLYEIPVEISSLGPTGWVRSVLGDDLFNVINYDELDVHVLSCMRNVQHLLYAEFA